MDEVPNAIFSAQANIKERYVCNTVFSRNNIHIDLSANKHKLIQRFIKIVFTYT